MNVANHTRQQALTIVEILVAVMALALLGTGAIAGLLAINRIATTSRFATNAQAIAQTAIDRVLAVPFSAGSAPPATLAPGTTTQANVPIYVDPGSGAVVVTGTVQTTITDISRPIVAGRPVPPLLHAQVLVSYFATGKNHTIALSTVRTTD